MILDQKDGGFRPKLGTARGKYEKGEQAKLKMKSVHVLLRKMRLILH